MEYDNVNVYGVNLPHDRKLSENRALFSDQKGNKLMMFLYSGEYVPVESVFYDKMTGQVRPTRLVTGSLVKVMINDVRVLNGAGDLIVSLGMQSSFNTEYPPKMWPARYRVKGIFRQNGPTFKLVSLKLGGEKFYTKSRVSKNIDDLFKFVETVVNEMGMFPKYQFPGKDLITVNRAEYWASEQRRTLLFWICCFDELSRDKDSLGCVEIKTGKYNGGRSKWARVGSVLQPKFDRAEMSYIPGKKVLDIKVKYCKSTGRGILTDKGWLIIDFPSEMKRAFWIIRYDHYEHFLDEKRMFDRTRADKEHPFIRHHHWPDAYKRMIEKYC